MGMYYIGEDRVAVPASHIDRVLLDSAPEFISNNVVVVRGLHLQINTVQIILIDPVIIDQGINDIRAHVDPVLLVVMDDIPLNNSAVTLVDTDTLVLCQSPEIIGNNEDARNT